MPSGTIAFGEQQGGVGVQTTIVRMGCSKLKLGGCSGHVSNVPLSLMCPRLYRAWGPFAIGSDVVLVMSVKGEQSVLFQFEV